MSWKEGEVSSLMQADESRRAKKKLRFTVERAILKSFLKHKEGIQCFEVNQHVVISITTMQLFWGTFYCGEEGDEGVTESTYLNMTLYDQLGVKRWTF